MFEKLIYRFKEWLSKHTYNISINLYHNSLRKKYMTKVISEEYIRHFYDEKYIPFFNQTPLMAVILAYDEIYNTRHDPSCTEANLYGINVTYEKKAYNIEIKTNRCGLIIGKHGRSIDMFTKKIEEYLNEKVIIDLIEVDYYGHKKNPV